MIPFKAVDFQNWMDGNVDQARALMKLAPMEVFEAGPTDAAQKENA